MLLRGLSVVVVAVAVAVAAVLAAREAAAQTPTFAPLQGVVTPSPTVGTAPTAPTTRAPTAAPTFGSHNITVRHFAKGVKCSGTPFLTENYVGVFSPNQCAL